MSNDDEWNKDPCVVDSETREWINWRTAWILREFGVQRVRSCQIVLPTTAFFPDRFAATELEVRELLDRICYFMDLNPDVVDLEFFVEQHESGKTGASGMYEKSGDRFLVWIETSLLDDPLAMAATMAHELSHVHLLGHQRIAEETDDHEPLTDLLTVFLGMGVITSNNVIYEENWSSEVMQMSRMCRRGYLSMDMYGYAIALLARIRDDPDVKWAKHLRPDVRNAMRKTLRYFDSFGMPDLSSEYTTSARPKLFRKFPDSEYHHEDDNLDPEFDELETDPAEENFCRYCGEPLNTNAGDSICQECQASIDQNAEDLEKETQTGERRNAGCRIVALGAIVVIVIAIITTSIYDWLMP